MGYARKSRAYTRRGYGKKSSASSYKKIYSRRPTANTQKYQILSLNKKYNTLNKKIQSQMYTVQHKHQITGILVQPFMANALVAPSAWTQVFGLTSENEGGKYTGYNMAIDFYVIPRTEHSRIDLTVFIASPKNTKVVSETGGAAATTLSNLLPDRDYTTFGGCALLNKKRWNIHKCYRMHTMPIVTEAGGTEYINSTHTNRRYCKLRNPLRVNNRTGDWYTIGDWEVKPSQRMHIFVFNNNISSLEGSPSININTLMTGTTSA